MNKVYISGTIVQDLRRVDRKVDGQAPHILFPLAVTHKTRGGEIRKEIYSISAWNGSALWAETNLIKGQRVMIQGYLAQKQLELALADGTTSRISLIEVAVDEFFSGTFLVSVGTDVNADIEVPDLPTSIEVFDE